MHVSLSLSSPSAGLAAGFLFLSGLAAAIQPPSYDGYSIVWQDDFAGAAGSMPNGDRWRTILRGPLNGETETYVSGYQTLGISGNGTVQLMPSQSPVTGEWTSARIETNDGFTPAAGRTTRVEGSIRMGVYPASMEQGIWPAFWMLAASFREGTAWPLCGELDILEQRNGVQTAFGTAHCGSSANGGRCNEPAGLGATTPVPADDGNNGGAGDGGRAFHRWSLTWDLTSADWQSQSIVWAVDGRSYFTLTGRRLADQATWSTLAHSPYNIILNVAVGGGFPGSATTKTGGGPGSMMEVQYVAVYST